MKKICLLLLVIMLVYSTASYAEGDFALRNGIKFGDTIDIILTKETTLKQEDSSNWFKGKIAGYSDAECGFYFDDDGKLISMDYSFGSSVCTSKDTTTDVYNKLVESLRRQYGAPLGNYGGSCDIITGPAFDRMALWVYFIGSLDGYSGNYYDYDEWIINCDNYNVKIDIISYYYRDNKYNYNYYVDLSYHYYTDEDYLNAIIEKQGERDEVDKDL